MYDFDFDHAQQVPAVGDVYRSRDDRKFEVVDVVTDSNQYRWIFYRGVNTTRTHSCLLGYFVTNYQRLGQS